jgi:hypothetical protein
MLLIRKIFRLKRNGSKKNEKVLLLDAIAFYKQLTACNCENW